MRTSAHLKDASRINKEQPLKQGGRTYILMSTPKRRGFKVAPTLKQKKHSELILKVQTSPPRQRTEKVVDGVARHANRTTKAKDSGAKVADGGDSKADDDGSGHDRAKVVNELAQSEEACPVKDKQGDIGDMEGVESVAVVHEPLAFKRGDAKAFLLVSRQDDSNGPLEDEEAKVNAGTSDVEAAMLRE